MANETYNGWTNYTTWGAALVLDNEQETHERCNEMAERFKRNAPDDINVPNIWTEEQSTRFRMVDWLSDYVEDLCGIEGGNLPLMARQMIGSALADVDWDEIANHYLSALED
jgi:hypothetical protein